VVFCFHEAVPGCSSYSISAACEAESKVIKEGLAKQNLKRSPAQVLEAVMQIVDDKLGSLKPERSSCFEHLKSRIVSGEPISSSRIKVLRDFQLRVPPARSFFQAAPGNVVIFEDVDSLNLDKVFVMPISLADFQVKAEMAEFMVSLLASANGPPEKVTWLFLFLLGRSR